MKIKTLQDIPEIKGKRILLRVDFNVPLDENLKVKDDTRIIGAIDTINYLRLKGGRVIIMSHLGRPKGEAKDELRLTNIATHLAKLIDHPVKKLDEVIGPDVQKEIGKMKDGDVLMLENIRFHNEETECESEFTKKLASLGEIFVNDAFGTAHRKHASTAGLADYLPAYGGLLIGKEIENLSPIIDGEPVRPLTMIFGGAKIDTKIGVIKNFINKADYFLMGGGIANTFLYAAGYYVGESLFQKDKKEIAQEIMLECEKHREKLILPHDVTVADEAKEDAETANIPIQDVEGDMKIFDIGKHTAEKFVKIIQKSGTIIWNGPIGLSELTPFREGSHMIADAIAKHNCTSIIGGGDTVECIKRLNVPIKAFTHVSTGGGACIEFLEGKNLPGITILKK